MKISKKFASLLTVTAMSAMLLNCKDEVLVPVEDRSMADSLTTKILEQQGLKININSQLNTVTLSNQKLKDSIADLDESTDDLANEERVVQYTVNVLSFGNSTLSGNEHNESLKRTSGFAGATVLVEQNGTQQTQTTANGLAVFQVKQGYVTVSISAADHGSVEYTAFVGFDHKFDGKARNAASQVFLFPTAGSTTATFKATVYMNNSILDDTLNYYTYQAAAGTTLQGQYVTNPGPWTSNVSGWGNETYNWWAGYSNNSIYGTAYANNLSFGKAAGYKVTAVPYFFQTDNQNDIPNNIIVESMDHGKIISMTYKGLIKSGVTNANGEVTITGIPASVDGIDVDFWGPEDGFVKPHSRFTNGSNQDKIGSSMMDFKVYNPATAKSSTVSREVKTDNWSYSPYHYRGNDEPELISGQTYNDAIFLFPRYQRGN